MIILEEKMSLPPPPPYVLPAPVSPPPPFRQSEKSAPTLTNIPPYILLRIVYELFSRQASIEKQRQTLYWLNINLRRVSRGLYIACMHVLRSTYLPAYTSLVRPPYTSDPFPHHNNAASTPSALSPYPSDSPVLSLQRETRVLDLFIALKVREDVWLDDSELHLERDESFRDLFDLMQPRSRMEDLVRHYGVREGTIVVGEPPIAISTSKGRQIVPIPFGVVSVSFSSRRVGLVISTRERKRTIVEAERTKDERLEVAAKHLVAQLRMWLCSGSH
ncbi:hypothetical protein EIP91_003564 [Steccherinum ochraceum]|uniref:Uncharacterized protein n=1 Tax=Steccherinum ochraceum TaxID=92696 RepID=A0A4R0RAC4_9APHY|nr:hypothetical protein EIP91_003564 [Steccherinum ochraceum]